LLDHLAAFPTARIRDIKTYNRRGVQPIYVPDGDVRVVNSKHLGPQHIDYDNLERTSSHRYSLAKVAHIQSEDILVYSTGAYVGRTNVYLDDAPAMASNHVNILRVNDGIDRAYLALVFQGAVGQFQTLKHVRGSAQVELYPDDIDRFVVPLIDDKKQKEIGDLVRSSLAKQRESRSLLEQARTRVEAIIGEAIEK
jgi:restriction endonuclease S subunit